MKSGTKPTNVQPARSVTLPPMDVPSSSLHAATTRALSTRRQMPSASHSAASGKLKKEPHRQYLSKSMERTFLRMKKSPTARDAYVQAEVVTALAHQIRAIRMQRNWSQADLAKKMGTTQAAVSRLEDPSYGRMSIKTLLDLSRVFDAGLRVQFVSLITMLHETFKPRHELREVPSFDDEAPYVDFYESRVAFSLTIDEIMPKSIMRISEYDFAIDVNGSLPMMNVGALSIRECNEDYEYAV
jgi:transcriptional regulator with XRE-family HTH domain